MAKEKKIQKPISIKLKPSTKEAVDKICHSDDRSISYVVEKCVRNSLGLD
jgi:predicted transcriptional regulator